LVVLLGVSYVFKEFFDWLRLRQMTVMGEWVAKDLRQQIFVHLQRLDLSYFSQQSTGGLVTRVSADSERVWDFIAFGVIDVSIALLTLVGLSAMLIYLDWQLGLIMALPLPLLLWSIFLHGQQIERLFTKCWRKWSQMTAIIADAIPGIMVVKAFSQQDQEINKFTIANNEAADEFVGQHLAWAKFWPMLVLGIHMIIIIAWCSALPRLFAPESDLSVGTFIAFLLYMTMYTQPVEVLGQMALMMNKATSSAQRIFEVLDTKAKITSPENAIMPDNLKGSIEFDRVSFSYNGIQPVLNNISFSVAPGEMIGLVGISGGGKSTITRLISRFYDCDQGSVLIDGINVKSFELNALRKNIGVVLQDPYLFRSSIWQNIAYGLPDISLSKVIDAARVANAHDFIMALPQGYETVIGERGHTLSGGERQRISIARAILHNPAILILDEATSSVDTQTERQIQQALDKVIKGRTVIAIAHRLSTLDKADRIFVIKQGEIVQSGTHQTLLSEPSGPYHALYYTQHSQQSGPSAQNRPSPQHPNPAGNANVQD
jgi:ATP-binding cassette subfamily B protein